MCLQWQMIYHLSSEHRSRGRLKEDQPTSLPFLGRVYSLLRDMENQPVSARSSGFHFSFILVALPLSLPQRAGGSGGETLRKLMTPSAESRATAHTMINAKINAKPVISSFAFHTGACSLQRKPTESFAGAAQSFPPPGGVWSCTPGLFGRLGQRGFCCQYHGRRRKRPSRISQSCGGVPPREALPWTPRIHLTSGPHLRRHGSRSLHLRYVIW